MQQHLSQDNKARMVFVLHGLGGSGKTQIALKFLESCNEYTTQFFVNASSSEALNTSFMNIAISQGFGATPEAGFQWLISKNKEWILLYDNADNPNLNLQPFFPHCTHGNIIITSRNPQLAAYGPASHSQVGNLDEKNAALLLLARAVKENTDENHKLALGIVQELSCLPLAIVQAGAYVARFKNLVNYLSLYRQNRDELWQQHPGPRHDNYEWTIYTTWQISFERLSPVAAHFLQLCALLHHSNIPESIFAKATEWIVKKQRDEAESLQEAREFLQNFVSSAGCWQEQMLRNIVAEIEEYSLIERHELSNTLSIHPLVHLWCLGTLYDKLPAQRCMLDVLGMAIDLGPDGNLGRIALRAHVENLVPDLASISSQFWAQYGAIYYDGGNFERARRVYELKLKKQRGLFGDEHPDTLVAMANLARTYSELGRHSEAEQLKLSVLQQCRRLLGDEHPDTLLTMGNLASTYSELGRHSEAEQLELSVLQQRRKLLGDEHPDTLLAMGNLASTYSELGRHSEAEQLELSVLQQRRMLLGDEHPDTLLTMGNLASTYSELGRHSEAEQLKLSVLQQRRKLLGDEHPRTLLAMGNLASIYSELGRHSEAEQLQLSVLQQRRKLLGDEHPRTLLAMGNLASTYSELGRHSKAEQLELSVLQQRRKLLGDEHPDTLLAMGNLASTYSELGRHSESEQLELSVLQQRRKLLGDEHPDTLLAMGNLARTYSELGRHSEAEQLELSVLQQRRKLLGDEHPDTLLAMGNIDLTSHATREYQAPEISQHQGLSEHSQVLGAVRPDTSGYHTGPGGLGPCQG
ncbi:hypothetical protein FB45DRAFT_212097 [Roridomyces roridus]|uniref:DUF7779 domain-containing protein n=1 Tax=Roridomyces roridus TaxID=1738132 RepID=A0AAD7CGS9_9AGAR|nr:hypothetical protein FB45DRAFT_212097 [Roridomyces roridus]